MEVNKKVNDYNFSLGKMHFMGDNDFQNMFIYQPTYNRLEIKVTGDGRQCATGWF